MVRCCLDVQLIYLYCCIKNLLIIINEIYLVAFFGSEVNDVSPTVLDSNTGWGKKRALCP